MLKMHYFSNLQFLFFIFTQTALTKISLIKNPIYFFLPIKCFLPFLACFSHEKSPDSSGGSVLFLKNELTVPNWRLSESGPLFH